MLVVPARRLPGKKKNKNWIMICPDSLLLHRGIFERSQGGGGERKRKEEEVDAEP